MAFKILQMDQAQLEADAWNEAGDSVQKLETSAIIIKDTCKVAGFIGGIVVTGVTAALATNSALSQMAVVVSGVDLTLEVSSDAANIGLGNYNKISAVIDTARVLTEPIASILTISAVPENIATKFEKFTAVMIEAEQFNAIIQDGKAVGIKVPAYTSNKKVQQSKVEVSTLEKSEIKQWLEDQGVKNEEDQNIVAQKILNTIIEKTILQPILIGRMIQKYLRIKIHGPYLASGKERLDTPLVTINRKNAIVSL